MGRKNLSLKPMQTDQVAKDTVELLNRLIPKFRNNSQLMALFQVRNLLKSTPREDSLESVIPGYSETIKARKPHKFYCLMAPLTTILYHYYWLHFNPKHEDSALRFGLLRKAFSYLEVVASRDIDTLKIRGNIGRGYLFQLSTPNKS